MTLPFEQAVGELKRFSLSSRIFESFLDQSRGAMTIGRDNTYFMVLVRRYAILILLSSILTSCGMTPEQPTSNSPVETSSKSQRQPSSTLESVHQALFEMFFPIERILQDPRAAQLATDVQRQIWQQINDRAEGRWGLRSMDWMAVKWVLHRKTL